MTSTPVQAPGTSGHVASIQVMRAIAAIMVTIAHASEEAKYFFGFVPWIETDSLGKGVDIFFVISGFIIYYSSIRLMNEPGLAKLFILNRLKRVVPLYYIFTTLMILAMFLIPSGVKEARPDLWQIITSYLFIPYARYDGRIAPVLSLGWTLNYEMFFYAIFAVCLINHKYNVASRTVLVLVGLCLVGLVLPAGAPAAVRAWTYSIILEFAMGIGIALAYERWGKTLAKSTLLAVLIAVMAFVSLYYLNMPERPFAIPRYVSAGVPAAVMVAAGVLLLPSYSEIRLPSWAVALGDSSYSLYLSHRFVQRPIQILVTKLNTGQPGDVGGLYVGLAVAAAIGVGHVVYLVLERPLLRRLRSKSSAHKRMVAGPAAENS